MWVLAVVERGPAERERTIVATKVDESVSLARGELAGRIRARFTATRRLSEGSSHSVPCRFHFPLFSSLRFAAVKTATRSLIVNFLRSHRSARYRTFSETTVLVPFVSGFRFVWSVRSVDPSTRTEMVTGTWSLLATIAIARRDTWRSRREN